MHILEDITVHTLGGPLYITKVHNVDIYFETKDINFNILRRTKVNHG